MSEDNPIVPRKGGELTKIGPKGNPILDTMVRDALQLAKENSALSEGVEVQFKCKNLEKAVRDALGMPEGTITRKDMLRLEKLTRRIQQVTYVSGLEHAQNLRRLDLNFNQIGDISPLREMTQLQWLCLGGNQIKDISPLRKLTELKYLFLQGNQIEDISPLREMTQLEMLFLWGNQIKDIASLRKLTQLKSVRLSENPLTKEQIADLKEALPECRIIF